MKTGGAGNNNNPGIDNLKPKGHFPRILKTGTKGEQWKVERRFKSDFTGGTKFSGSMLSLLSLISLLFLSVSCNKESELTAPVNDFVNIPDNQFESILIEQNLDSDGVINQKISQTDALGITHLDLNSSASNVYIEDLTGIEGFTNLTYLSASGHLIDDVDLSNNTLLDTVLLQANELHSIHGLSKLNNLIYIDLSWNLLESLSFKSESVETVLAGNNLLEFFEVENAEKLKGIILTSNKLSSLNTGAYQLLETLLLSVNQLETIDLMQNDNLSHLYISGNLLSELSVSSNRNLVDLRVDRNPGLTCIQINNDQEIPTISLSEYQELSTNCN